VCSSDLNFNAVLCKTNDCQRIFKEKGLKTIYTSFTSADKYDADIKKSNVFIHWAGASSHKNTEAVIKTWEHKELNKCFVFSRSVKGECINNLVFSNQYLSNEQQKIMLNGCLFHLVPSQYEGFGHYINEARSTGAILIGVDAQPMNELCLPKFSINVPVKSKSVHMFGNLCHIDEKDLYKACIKSQNLSQKEIKEMSEASRQAFLDNDIKFKKIFIQTINDIIQ
jgi:hypothetical protein